MSNPSSKLFHRIVRRNRSDSASTGTRYIKYNERELHDSSEQIGALKNFMRIWLCLRQSLILTRTIQMKYQSNIKILIKILCNETRTVTEAFKKQDIQKAVSKLNTGKSADKYGIQTEHLKLAVSHILPLFVKLFNEIVSSAVVPDSFKTGVLTPVHKKGKDPTSVDNYRGITVTATIGKVFGYALLDKLIEKGLNSEQSELQVEFSEGLSPGVGSLLLSEASYDAYVNRTPLYIAPMDSQIVTSKIMSLHYVNFTPME